MAKTAIDELVELQLASQELEKDYRELRWTMYTTVAQSCLLWLGWVVFLVLSAWQWRFVLVAVPFGGAAWLWEGRSKRVLDECRQGAYKLIARIKQLSSRVEELRRHNG